MRGHRCGAPGIYAGEVACWFGDALRSPSGSTAGFGNCCVFRGRPLFESQYFARASASRFAAATICFGGFQLGLVRIWRRDASPILGYATLPISPF